MIEQMTHIAVLSRAEDKNALLKWLYGERAFHVMPIAEVDNEEWAGKFDALPDDTPEVDSELTRIASVVSFCQEHCTNKPSFLDAMLPLKVVGSKVEIDSALEEVDVGKLSDETARMRSGIENSNEKIARLQNQKAAIEQFAFLDEDLPKLNSLKHFKLDVVAAAGQGGKAFLMDERIAKGSILAQELFADQTHTYYALVVPVGDAELLKSLIDDHGLHVHPLPAINRGARQEILLINNDIMEAKAVLAKREAEANAFADAWLKKAGLVAGYYESEKNLALARTGMSASDHLFVARGYLKSENFEAFKDKLEAAVPGSTAMPCEAPAEEEPPISMKWNKWISPASLLVKMYGLPSYKGIDPTPFVATIFFAFVGICLGDAAYGIALVLIMQWLKKKYKEQAGLQDFFQCFVYCGYSSILFGALTGSFMGNLASKIPGMGWFAKIQETLALIDPIKDSQLALYIAIGIGVLSQIYGMCLLVHRNWRRGDKMGAFSDGVLWIGFLVFAILGAATGSWFFWALFIVTIILLVATQGRDQSSFLGKVAVGFISLYGIVGGYGASAILGDLISYARLMALALTGAALGSTFNMLAELSVEIPYVGLIAAVAIVVGGHAMNFFLNILSGFVHSARLIMLEFFGRFYEAGGYAYKPYGFDSQTVEVKKN